MAVGTGQSERETVLVAFDAARHTELIERALPLLVGQRVGAGLLQIGGKGGEQWVVKTAARVAELQPEQVVHGVAHGVEGGMLAKRCLCGGVLEVYGTGLLRRGGEDRQLAGEG